MKIPQQSREQQSRAREQAGVSVDRHVQIGMTGDGRKGGGSRSLIHPPQYCYGGRAVAAHLQAGFTMMEIAISLAIIGIALVAIIGVLPIGMNVQQDNRQETIINQDAALLIEDLRNGSIGMDELTNYVFSITNYFAIFIKGGASKGASSAINTYTYSSSSVAPGYPNGSPANAQPLTNAANIIGLLSTPEFTDFAGNPTNNLYNGGISNHIVASVYSISGLAVEKPPQDNPLMHQDSMAYHLFVVNAPVAFDTNNVVFNQNNSSVRANADQMDNALRELRLTFLYPLLPNGHVGSGTPKTFRTLVAGQLVRQSVNAFNSSPFYDNLYVYQSQSFVNSYLTNTP
jgi:prepilin-type N-terminal cleavage/methylation domain-containing protein